jgi:hypothetical protein
MQLILKASIFVFNETIHKNVSVTRSLIFKSQFCPETLAIIPKQRYFNQ